MQSRAMRRAPRLPDPRAKAHRPLVTAEPSRTKVEAASETEVAGYIAAISRDLSVMAEQAGHALLAYLLDMAHQEAKARRGSGSR